jgi:hypothetical protein
VVEESVFEPECIHALALALEEAWTSIEASGSRLAGPGYARAMREVIAKQIITLAQQGVTDQKALADGAIRFFAENYAGRQRSANNAIGTRAHPGICRRLVGPRRRDGGVHLR